MKKKLTVAEKMTKAIENNAWLSKLLRTETAKHLAKYGMCSHAAIQVS